MRTIRTLLLATVLVGAAVPAHAQTTDPLEGVWLADQYLLAGGHEHPVAGQIFFTDGRWQVLFFVMDADGAALRGSAEGGTYDRTSDGLVFTHLHNLSVGEAMPGLAAADLRMVTRDPDGAPLEPTEITIDGDVLTLHFPSGNRMLFQRG